MLLLRQTILFILLCIFTLPLSAEPVQTNLTNHPIGIAALIIFCIAYLLVMTEEYTNLRKSKPVIFAAGVIWALLASVYMDSSQPEMVSEAIQHNFLEYAELLMFLLVAMTYINAMIERKIFDTLRSWLIRKGLGYRQLFLLTGILSFLISPVADNLTTALLMSAVVLAVGGDNKKFISLSCINIVVASNAGGAFSPFGDITTLMVWQKGLVSFTDFFSLFIPSVISFAVPSLLMYRAVPNIKPERSDQIVHMKRGAKRIILLFFLTILTAICFHGFLHLPPVFGMMTGLAYLKLFGYYLNPKNRRKMLVRHGDIVGFDVFDKIARAEWDTLLFFYGVVLCVGGLGFIGYLTLISETLYTGWGATQANISIGFISSIIDNIPVMFAVLSMQPDMSLGQWLLVTLTAGVGGSLLSIGSAAGVALMGQAHGKYTFISHLKWTPVIALGYAASIATHLWLNHAAFQIAPRILN